MFDFGFSELVMIGVVALVVLGPEKLPVVAKAAGQWMGKAQRMVQQVKSDIEREVELSELKKIQEEAKSVAENLNKTVKGELDSINTEVKSLEMSVNEAAREMTEGFESGAKELSGTSGMSETAEVIGTDVGEVGEVTTAADDFYGWYSGDGYVDDRTNSKTTFEKRYKAGPSIDELVEQIERLKAELGDRSPQLGGSNRRFASRARSNRVRIYR